jgi:hypothetical protein
MWCLFFVPICNKNALHLQLLLSGTNREEVLKQLKDVVGDIEPYYHCTKDHGDKDPYDDKCYDHEIADDRETFRAKDGKAVKKVIANSWSWIGCCPFGADKFVLTELEDLKQILSFKDELEESIV